MTFGLLVCYLLTSDRGYRMEVLYVQYAPDVHVCILFSLLESLFEDLEKRYLKPLGLYYYYYYYFGYDVPV